MLIEKPGWLRSWLDGLNWDILGWRVYVGDAIESGIDWLLEWLSQTIAWGQELYALVADLIEEVRETLELLWEDLGREVLAIRDLMANQWDRLREWWEARRSEVLELINAATDWIRDRLEAAERLINTLELAWDQFWTDTWPTWTSSLEYLVWQVGDFFTHTLPTLANHFDIAKALADFRLEIQGLFNLWEEFREDLSGFLSEPIEWLFNKAVDWLLGPEV